MQNNGGNVAQGSNGGNASGGVEKHVAHQLSFVAMDLVIAKVGPQLR